MQHIVDEKRALALEELNLEIGSLNAAAVPIICEIDTHAQAT